MHQEFGRSLVIILAQGLMRLQAIMSARAAVTWRLDSVWRIQFWNVSLTLLMGQCWLSAGGLSSSQLGSLHKATSSHLRNTGSGFPRTWDPREQGSSHSIFYDLASEVPLHLQPPNGYTGQPYSVWGHRGIAQRHELQKARINVSQVGYQQCYFK